MRTKIASLLGVFLALLSAPLALHAQQRANFKGKDIRIIVGTAPGGGYDSYARLVATHLPKHLLGGPNIIVQNMPGAGSLTLLNYLANVAPKDGTVLGAVHSISATYPLFIPDRVRFDARSLAWIGSTLREHHLGIASRTSGVKNFQDVIERELIIAGAGGATISFPVFSNEILGTKFKIVRGYEGSRPAMLALERGEVNGFVGISWSTLKTTSPALMKDGSLQIFVQFGLTKHPELPHVPWVFDCATPDNRASLDLMFSTQEFGRPYVAPPGLAPSVVSAIRQAFSQMMTDHDFITDAAKRKLDLDFTSGEEIQKLIERIYQASPKDIARVRQIVGDQIPQ